MTQWGGKEGGPAERDLKGRQCLRCILKNQYTLSAKQEKERHSKQQGEYIRRLWVRKQYGSFSEMIALVKLELEIYGEGNAGDKPDDEGPSNLKRTKKGEVWMLRSKHWTSLHFRKITSAVKDED